MTVPLSLDQILPDTQGKTITLFGDLSSKRNQLVKQFILDGFANEGTSCVVTLTVSASELIEELSSYSPEASLIVNEAILNERLQIIDMYSFRGIEQDEDIPGTHVLPSSDDLTLLSINLNKIMKSHPKTRITIWPYSLLAIYTTSADLINFTQTLSARISSKQQVGLLLSDNGVIPSEERRTLEAIVDSVVETKREEQDGQIKEFFRVKFFRGAEDTPHEMWTLIG